MFEKLKNIGMTEGEIKVYKAMLDLGECTKTALAKQSGVAPSNIYDITNRLLEKGMISKVEKDGIAHFSPANPKNMLDFIDRKHREIEKEKSLAMSLMPSLMTKFGQSREKVNIEVFQGWRGMKTIFNDLIEECRKNDENLIFGASKGEQDERAGRFFIKYSKLRGKKGIKTKMIFNKDMRKHSRLQFFKKSKNYDVKFLLHATPAEIMIYKNKTCIIILTQNPLVIRITGKETSDSFRQYFNAMWELAKK